MGTKLGDLQLLPGEAHQPARVRETSAARGPVLGPRSTAAGRCRVSEAVLPDVVDGRQDQQARRYAAPHSEFYSENLTAPEPNIYPTQAFLVFQKRNKRRIRLQQKAEQDNESAEKTPRSEMLYDME